MSIRAASSSSSGCSDWTSSLQVDWLPSRPGLHPAGLCTTWLSSVCPTWSRPKAPSSTCPALTARDQWVSTSGGLARLFQHRLHNSVCCLFFKLPANSWMNWTSFLSFPWLLTLQLNKHGIIREGRGSVGVDLRSLTWESVTWVKMIQMEQEETRVSLDVAPNVAAASFLDSKASITS